MQQVRCKLNNMKKNNTQSGFTLVEMMISVGLFSVVMIFGIGSVLAVNETHRQSQVRRAALDSVNFIMEEISRSARLGDLFRCASATPISDTEILPNFSNIEVPLNGENCGAFSFEPYNDLTPGDSDDQRVYVIASTEDGVALFKSPEGVIATDSIGNTWLRLTSNNITIDPDMSGFYVYGAEQGDGEQPRVVIRLAGQVVESGGRAKANFSVQTTVSQRLLQPTL